MFSCLPPVVLKSVNVKDQNEKKLKILVNKAIVKITSDYGDRISLNTVVSTCMELLNNINSYNSSASVSNKVIYDAYKILILLLAPITPHICQEIALSLKISDSIIDEEWPIADNSLIKDDIMIIVVQVNGKVRKKIEINSDAKQKYIEDYVISLDEIKKYTKDKGIKKIIYIKEKLVNIVTE